MDSNFLMGLTSPYMAEIDKYNITKSENLKRQIESDGSDEKQLMDACKTFEGYFLQMMYKSMRNTIDTSGSVIPQSNAEKIFQDMLDEEYSKKAAGGGNGIGLAQMLYKQLSRGHKNKIVE